MPEVFASLGSNQDRERNIRSAVQALDKRFGPLRLSPVYLSKTVGFDGDDFLNLVVAFESGLSPEDIQQVFREIEDDHGRVRGEEKFAPRQLDIDLILYDDLVLDNDSLKLPRVDIEEYAFVLRPLADLQPNGIHPLLKKPYASMWQEYDKDQALSEFPLDFEA
jgi:2-amino-4-hydroxy-6-hydroxymethyldihydropteridine diphosphokinase